MDKDYLSVKDFAETVGISKQAVYQQLNKRLEHQVVIYEGRKYIKKTALNLFDEFNKREEEKEQIQRVEQELISDLKRENEEKQELINELKEKIEKQNVLYQEEIGNKEQLIILLEIEKGRVADLEEQLQKKDVEIGQIREDKQNTIDFLKAQLEEKDKQIAENNKALIQQQQLHALDKQKILELEDKKSIPEKKWWQIWR